jgi:pyrimidine operon attenuation protein/uracil phosphoribosyltransferase
MKDILSTAVADGKLKRMALQVAEYNYQASDLVIIGIKENGVVVAQKVATYLAAYFQGNIEILALSINKKDPGEIILSKQTNLKGKAVLLVDDVVNSGRTLFYALQPLLEQKPSQVQILALIERTHKKFPIAVDYVGLSVSTTLQENIEVIVEGEEILGARMN